MEERNPVQILTDISGEMRQLADSLRVTDPEPGENDIPDIYDTAASLLTTIVTCKAGFDPNQNLLQKVAEFDSYLLQQEREFVKKMEQNMNDLATKIEDLQEGLNQRDEQFEIALKQVPGIFEAALDKLQNRNAERLQNLSKKWEEDYAKKAAEEETMKASFEERKNLRISEVERLWQQKLADADTEIANKQRDLQLAIHSKQEQTLRKTEQYKGLEKANEAEVEHEKAILESIKADAENELKMMQESLDAISKECAEESQKAQKLADELEESSHKKRKELEQKFNAEYEAAERELEDLSEQLMELQGKLEMKRAQGVVKVRERQKLYDTQLKSEQVKTQQMIAEAVDKINSQYRPKIEVMRMKIVKAEKDRCILMEDLSKGSIAQAQGDEEDIIEMNRKHQATRALMRSDLRKQKHELQEILVARSRDIDEIKQNLENEVQRAQERIVELGKQHERNAAELLNSLKERQKQLDDEKEQNIAVYNKKRSEELKRLEEEHRLRVQDIIYTIEQRFKIEGERAYNAGVKDAQMQHQQEVSVIKSRINDFKNQIDACRVRMEEMNIAHARKQKELEETRQQELADQKKILREDFEKEKAQIVANQRELTNKISSLAKKKAQLQKSITEVQKKIDIMAMNNPIESALDVLRQSLSSMVAQLKHDEADLIIEKRKLEKAIKSMQAKTDEFRKLADEKEQEFAEFEAVKEEKMNYFIKEVKEKWEAAFEAAKHKTITVEQHINESRAQYREEIRSYDTEIASRQELHDSTVSELRQVQAQKLKSREEQLAEDHEFAMKKLQSDHDKLMESMREEQRQMRENHVRTMKEIRDQYDEDSSNAEMAFLGKQQQLSKQKEDLLQQRESLKAKISETPVPECDDCKQRKEAIQRLQGRRDELQRRCDDLSKEVLASDAKMNAMFARGKTAKAGAAASPRVTRPVSAMKRTFK